MSRMITTGIFGAACSVMGPPSRSLVCGIAREYEARRPAAQPLRALWRHYHGVAPAPAVTPSVRLEVDRRLEHERPARYELCIHVGLLAAPSYERPIGAEPAAVHGELAARVLVCRGGR